MTGEVQEFVSHCVEHYPLRGAVLEVGSFDVCGNPRHHFLDETLFPSYIGVDRNEGPNVDRVMSAHALAFPSGSFGVVISCEMLEHDPSFWRSVREMARVLTTDGFMILTARSWRGCPPHGDGYGDYWRFMPEGMEYLLKRNGLGVVEVVDCETDFGVFALGQKLPGG